VVGWRGMYPGSKLSADFGHFLGVSQGVIPFVRRVGRGTRPVLAKADVSADEGGSGFDPEFDMRRRAIPQRSGHLTNPR